jgi:hypothetical protein
VDIPSRLTIELDNADVENCKTTSAKSKVLARVSRKFNRGPIFQGTHSPTSFT